VDISHQVLVGLLYLELIVCDDEQISNHQAVVVVVSDQMLDRQLLRQLKYQPGIRTQEVMMEPFLTRVRRGLEINLRVCPVHCESKDLEDRLRLDAKVEYWDLVNARVQSSLQLPILPSALAVRLDYTNSHERFRRHKAASSMGGREGRLESLSEFKRRV